MKTCTKCKEAKPLDGFGRDKQKKDNLKSLCKVCSKLKGREHYSNNKDYYKNRSRKYYLDNKEVICAKTKAYQQDNRDKTLLNKRIYRDKNRSSINEYQRGYVKDNSGKFNAKQAKRRASKLKATPTWYEKEAIKQFYINCPEGYHVDHIIPLQGKNVRGLHVLANLQYLTIEENLRKSNKF